jgi:hypothetical protein
MLPSLAAASEPASAELIKGLIRDLGDQNFKVRDTAARALAEIEEAIPALIMARKGGDAEVARLAGRILEEFEKSAIRRSLDRLRIEAGKGEASRVIERFTRWEGPDKDAISWQIALDFAWEVARHSAKAIPSLYERWRADKGMLKSVMDFGPSAGFICSKGRLTLERGWDFGFVRANGIVCNFPVQVTQSVLVTSDGFEGQTRVFQSIVLASGSVLIRSPVFDSILICDGEVELRNPISNCLVIANGAVKCPEAVGDSIIISSVKISADRAKKRKAESARSNVYVENEATPFNFVKWFTTGEIGLEVSTATDAVRIDKLHDGKLPSKCGLKVSDLITAVDGGKVDSTETFRKLLRRGSVQDRCVLTVQRDGTPMELTLDFRAEERAAEKMKPK